MGNAIDSKDNPINLENLVEVQMPEWWEMGVKSSVKKLLDKDTHKSYLVKKIPLKYAKDALVELATINVLQKYPETKDIFCRLVDHKREHDCFSFAFEIDDFYTLDKRVRDKEEKIEPVEVIESLKPIVLLNKCIKYRDEIENELKQLNEMYNAGITEENIRLNELTPEMCAKKFVKYADWNNHLEENERKEIEDLYTSLARRYFVSQALIQTDAYPWHNRINKITDAGEIGVGPAAWHMGCTFGYPGIFNKFKNKKEGMKHIANQYSLLAQCNGKKEIEEGLYLFSAHTNYRLARGFFNEDEKKDMRETALEQLNILGEGDESAKKMAYILRHAR